MSRVRVEEKLLVTKFGERGLDVDFLDDRELIFDLGDPGLCGRTTSSSSAASTAPAPCTRWGS